MINLLPPEPKKELLLKRKKGVVLANWILIISFSLLLLSTIFLLKFYLQMQTAYLKTQLISNKQILERSADKKFLDSIGSLNSSFEKLNTFYEQRMYISEILEKVSQVLPSKAYLTDFSISPNVVLENKDDKLNEFVGFDISVSGFSPTREELLQLQENMGKEKSFTGVYFPLTNWVKSTNIDFSFSFKVPKP